MAISVEASLKLRRVAMKSQIFFVVLVSFLIFFTVNGHRSMGVVQKDKTQKMIKTIYSFGDSLTDTGNLMQQGNEDPAIKALTRDMSSYPYGLTTFNTTTGRCSDGLLVIDYLANELGLPFLNPYLQKEANFRHGVNFAVAGATAQDFDVFKQMGTEPPITNSSLSVQLSWFKTHLKSKCSDCAEMLKESLIVLGEIGGDDYNYELVSKKSIQDVYGNIPQVINKIISAAQELIDIGASNIIIPGNLPIGCLPSYLTIFNATQEQCLEPFNDLAKSHNEKLVQSIKTLKKQNPNVNIIYADFYETYMHMLNNAHNLGFEEPFKACCGAGGKFNFDTTIGCGTPNATLCEDTTRYISWDGIHLTQQAYLMFTRILLTDGYTKPNFNRLYKWSL